MKHRIQSFSAAQIIIGAYIIAIGLFTVILLMPISIKPGKGALFHSMSAYTNAGFEIFGNSLMGFADDYFVQIITMLLIISGSVGFPVLVEFHEYLFGKTPHFRFSLFTKITSITFFGLLFAGAIGFWVMERQLFMEGKTWHAQLFYSIFSSVTSRSAGMTTLDMTDLGAGTQFFTSILMFIGGSPSSVGGGIRTTTFAVIILTLISVARSRKEVMVFKRTLKHEDVLRSFFVFAIAIILCVVSVFILDITEVQRFTLISILFEVGSAFGTCGLSLGITSQLSDAGKPVLIVLMFIGRIGLLTLLYMFRNEKQRPLNVRYPEEKIIIG
ncbi:MAG: potassium transporter TrkG [Paenibacillaceae bacterium]